MFTTIYGKPLSDGARAFIDEVLEEWHQRAVDAYDAHLDGIDGAFRYYSAATRVIDELRYAKRRRFSFSLLEEAQAESMAGCK